MAVSPSIVPFLGASLVQWSTVLAVTECWGLTVVGSSLLVVECKFAPGQGRFGLNTAESTAGRPSLLGRLGGHGSGVAILAHSTSLSAGLAGLVARGRAQERRWCYGHGLESPVEGVTMCTLYSPVACCGSKPQHCTLFRGKFGPVVYGTGRNTCLVFLKQAFHVKIVNLINASICVIILFWIFLMCESHFSLISSCTLNTRTIIVDFRMTFSTLIVIVMSNRLWFFAKCSSSYLIDAKRASCRRVHSSQMTWIFFNALQLLVMLVSYVRMLISFTKFMIVILYLNRSKIFKMSAL